MSSAALSLQYHPLDIDLVLDDGSFCNWAGLLNLLRREFAHTQGQVSPPSTVYNCSETDLKERAKVEKLLLAYDGSTLIGCLFMKQEADHLFLGRFAISYAYRSHGLARRMVNLAVAEAKKCGVSKLALETRVELIENQVKFSGLGFEIVGGRSHTDSGPHTTYRMVKTL